VNKATLNCENKIIEYYMALRKPPVKGNLDLPLLPDDDSGRDADTVRSNGHLTADTVRGATYIPREELLAEELRVTEPVAEYDSPIGRLRLYRASKEETPVLFADKFVDAVAKAYNRYGLHNVKEKDLREGELRMVHLVLLDDTGNVHGTLSVQHSNGRGTQATHMFEVNADKDDLHKKLTDKYPAYIELKNLSLGEQNVQDQYDNNTNLLRMNFVLNALVLQSVEELEKSAPSGTGGVIAVMPRHVSAFVGMNGIELTNTEFPTFPKRNDVEFLMLALDHPSYFVSGSGVLQVFKEKRDILVENSLIPANYQLPEESRVKIAIRNDEVRENLENHTDNYPDVREFMTYCANAAHRGWFTPEEMARIISPKLYFMPAKRLRAIVEENLRNNSDMARQAAEQMNANSAEIIIDNAEVYGQRSPRQITNRNILINVLPGIPDNKITWIRTVQEKKNYSLVHLYPTRFPVYFLPALEAQYGDRTVKLYDERLFVLEGIPGFSIRSTEDARLTALAHGMTRAGMYSFADFEPRRVWNNPAEHLKQVMEYLSTKGTHHDKIRNTKVGIMGQGTVGQAPLRGMVRKGFNNIRISEKLDETVSKHNMERMAAGINEEGFPKLAIAQRQVYDENPFTNLDIFPKAIESLNEARDFVKGMDIVVSAADDPRAMYFLHRAARERGIPVVLVTDIAGGVKVQVFDYRNASTPLFNGGVRKKLIQKFEDGVADGKDFNEFLASMVGMRRIKGRTIPKIDIAIGVPRRSIEFFNARIEGRHPHLAQDHTSAEKAGQQIERVIERFAIYGELPTSDYYDVTPEPRDLRKRGKEILRLLKNMKR
jgi:tRNA A37 threonylcarbamoyladenosine dehydratase